MIPTTTSGKNDLASIRVEIDAIDRQIADLFEKRMKLAADAADYKREAGLPVLDASREKEILRSICAAAQDPASAFELKNLFSEIMSMSRKRQYRLLSSSFTPEDPSEAPFDIVGDIRAPENKIVYQGVPGAYSHEASLSYFGQDACVFPVRTFEDAMAALSGGQADHAVLPIDNSTAGIVADVYDLLIRFDHHIVGEIYLPIRHTLWGVSGASLSDIETVYSHPQGLMQCRDYLNTTAWERVPLLNTAAAACTVSEDHDPRRAAIAGSLAGKLYGLVPLDTDICRENNVTRFIIVSEKRAVIAGGRKISICFEIAHEVCSLYRILSHISFNGLNMTKIESRPIPEKNWEYRFFVDIEGNLNDPGVKNALLGIRSEASAFRLLGNY